MSRPTSELLAPSLEERETKTGQPPWRVSSQVWVALLGGALPVTVVAYFNARRLGLSEERRRGILAVGALGVALTLVAVWAALEAIGGEIGAGGRSRLRLASRAVALLTYLGLAWIQRPADRAFQIFGEGDYASLWKVGIATTLLLGTLQNVIVLLAAAWLAG